MATSRLHVDPKYIAKADAPGFADAFARIGNPPRLAIPLDSKLMQLSTTESHYFVNAGFMPQGSLLKQENVDKIRHIPTTIVQGISPSPLSPETSLTRDGDDDRAIRLRLSDDFGLAITSSIPRS